MKEKRIYVLGAGSSIGHSNGIFPNITGFFEKAKKLGITESLDENLKAYINKSIGGRNFLWKTKIDIEKLATLIEIEIERNPSAKNLAVRENLLDLIQKVLTNLNNQINVNSGEYNFLKEFLRESDTVITFNWDLLFDSILQRDAILKEWYSEGEDRKTKGLYYNFILYLSGLGENTYAHMSPDSPYQDWKSNIGYLLKLHGSIDWFYCNNAHCRTFCKVYPMLDADRDSYCGECHEKLFRLLIPPILNKAYRQYPLIRRIWNLAVKEISVADEIIIWGYSLPATDFYSEWLLRHALQPIQRLVLINPEVITPTKQSVKTSYIKKFADLFRGAIPRSKIELYENFTDFVTGHNIYKKYKYLK